LKAFVNLDVLHITKDGVQHGVISDVGSQSNRRDEDFLTTFVDAGVEHFELKFSKVCEVRSIWSHLQKPMDFLGPTFAHFFKNLGLE
jgi:hypothetical protein